MLEHDVETMEPEFEEVKKVVLEKAKSLGRRKLFIGGRVMGLDSELPRHLRHLQQLRQFRLRLRVRFQCHRIR